MAIEQLKLKLTGARPFLMHNARLSDPLDAATKALKEVTGKRNKTDDDHLEVGRLEFIGGLYLDEKGHPMIPSDMILACLTGAARKSKDGKRFQEGVWCDVVGFPLKYDGPKDAMGLWNAPKSKFCLRRSVKVKQARVMRTRPRFPLWAAEVLLSFDTAVLDKAEILHAAEVAGSYVGIGDWRPQYGRFTVEAVK